MRIGSLHKQLGLLMAIFPNKMYVLEKFGWEFISKKSYFTEQSVIFDQKFQKYGFFGWRIFNI